MQSDKEIKGILKVIAMAIFVALPFAAFYLGAQYEKAIYQTPTTNAVFSKATNSDQVINTSNSSTTLIADWKTYRNEKYGFEFKYPGEWSSSAALEEQNFIYATFDLDSLKLSDASFSIIDDYGRQDFYSPNPQRVRPNFGTIEQILDQAKVMEEQGTTIKEITIGGEKGLEAATANCSKFNGMALPLEQHPDCGGSVQFYSNTLMKRNINVIFDFSVDAKYIKDADKEDNFDPYPFIDKEFILYIRTILSTFKFIEPQAVVSTSTSYTACGCGCCGRTTPKNICLYHAKGDDLDQIVEQDKLTSQSSNCALAGCSIGTRYSYCD